MSSSRVKVWVGASALSLLLAAVTAASAPKSECQIAREWVAANADALPSTLAELSTHSMAVRRQVVAVLPVEKRVSLWREHFAAILAGTESFTPQQRAFVEEVSERVPEFMENPMLEATVRDRMLSLFSVERAARYFANLGPTNDPALMGNTAYAVSEQGCTCSASGTNFCSLFTCRNLGNCESSPTGCGWLWQQPCDGLCGNIDS